MPDDPIVAVTRVSGKGLVLIPREIREKLDLQPRTKLIVVAVEDAGVLQKVEALSLYPRNVPFHCMSRQKKCDKRGAWGIDRDNRILGPLGRDEYLCKSCAMREEMVYPLRWKQ